MPEKVPEKKDSRFGLGWEKELRVGVLLSVIGLVILGGGVYQGVVQSDPAMILLVSILAFGLFFAAFQSFREYFQKRAVHDVLERVDTEIRSRLQAGGAGLAAAEGAIEAALKDAARKLDPGQAKRLIRQRLQTSLTNDEGFRASVPDILVHYLQPLPRNVIRLVNRFKLNTNLAYERKLLTTEPRVSIPQIAKWMVLCERWPQLVKSLSAQPDQMKVLESDAQTWKSVKERLDAFRAPKPPTSDRKQLLLASDNVKAAVTAFAEPIKVLSPDYLGDADLLEFCASEPKLGPVLSRLVHFGDVGGEAGRGTLPAQA